MKHILNNISQEEKQRILEQHSGGRFIDTSGFKRLLESKLGDVKPLVMEEAIGNTQTTTAQTTTPGDPSQSTVDLSTDYATLYAALTTYNSTVQSIMGVDPGLFLRSSNKAPSQLLITSGKRQDDSGQGMSGDNFVLRYDIPTGVLKRRVGTTPPTFYTLTLDGNEIGTGAGKGIWSYGLNADLMKNAKKVEQVKAAANIAGAAIAAFFSKVQSSVPKNYVVNQSRSYADGTAKYVFGPPTV